jgi:hypothetical protein
MSKRRTSKRKSWIVTAKITVIKELVCEDCTEEQARADPFRHSVSEEEKEMPDYVVLRVEPNE